MKVRNPSIGILGSPASSSNGGDDMQVAKDTGDQPQPNVTSSSSSSTSMQEAFDAAIEAQVDEIVAPPPAE